MLRENILAGWMKLSLRLAALVLFCFKAAVAQTSYTVTDLGTLGGSNSVPQGINNRGQVVGYAETGSIDPNCGCPVIHAFLWQKGVMEDLGALGGRNSGAGLGGINPEGEVVGAAETPTVDPTNPPFLESRAFLWQRGVMTDLGTVGGNDSGANAINSEHQVVGSAQTGQSDPFFGQQFHPFLWEKGVMSDLGTLGGLSGFAAGINELGQVVGGANVGAAPVPPFTVPPFFAFLWENGVMTNLGALGGIESLAFAVNNRSQIAGEFTFVDPSGTGISHAFLWRSGVMQDLGTVAGDQGSIAYAIDHAGGVVGGSGLGFIENFSPVHAFLWQNDALIDLNTRIPASAGLQLIVAFGINARGQIVACGVEASGNVHAILLAPRGGAGGVARMQEETNTRSHVTLSPDARRLLRYATAGQLRSKPGSGNGN